MKLIKILLIVGLLGGMHTACNEATVNIEPIGYTEAGFFQTPTDVDWGVKGIYHNLNFFYSFFLGNAANVMSALWQLPSDDLTSDANYAEENFTGITGSSSRVRLFYQYAYQLIARANTVLEKIEQDGDAIYATSPELRAHHRGEALFLRAWMYERLWQVFGTAPLVTQRISDFENDAYPPNSQGTQLLDQAITDLQEAATLLPSSWNAANLGRVTKNSAYGLLGKILVFRGTVTKNQADFTAAITAINQITGRSLVANYGDNFSAAAENNSESLFEYQANRSIGITNPFLNSNDFAAIGDITAYYGTFSGLPSWITNNYFYATPSIQNAFEAGDPRVAFMLGKPTMAPASAANANVKKYLITPGEPVVLANNGNTVNNPRILRLADVLLLKAEALVRSGGSLTEAIGIINSIRTRARNSATGAPAAAPANRNVNESDRAVVLNWIFQERRLELAFEEGHRWWDLRRRHLAGEIDLRTWNFNSALPGLVFENKNIVYPLPDGEVVSSPNLQQNPGY